MNNLTSALSTLTPPPSDPRRERRLAGSVVGRTNLTHAERDEMYGLLEEYFDGTCRTRFEVDLGEKESVIMLRDVESGRIRGFSTSMRIASRINGQDVVAFFSGDTIIAREYWGDTLLSRLWSQTVFAEADLRRRAVEIMDGHVLGLEDNLTTGGEARGDQILDDLVLGVDSDGFAAREAAQVDAMAAPVEAEFDAVMEEGLVLEAFAHARFDHQVDGALF